MSETHDVTRWRLSLARRLNVTPAAAVFLKPYPYATTHRLYQVGLPGSQKNLILKDLRPSAVVPEAEGVRPRFVNNPRREIYAYTRLLGRCEGPPSCVMAVADETAGEYWLLLEKAPGVPLWQTREDAMWAAAARWIARFHRETSVPPEGHPLLQVDTSFYETFAERAEQNAVNAGRGSEVRRVLLRFKAAVETLSAVEVTVLHGDFGPSNVLVDHATGRVSAIDWEMASIGPGVLDLAALVSGWDAETRNRLAAAYRRARSPSAGVAEFTHQLDCARLALCVQWLGWSAKWMPPAAHRRDWLAEATEIASRFGR